MLRGRWSRLGWEAEPLAHRLPHSLAGSASAIGLFKEVIMASSEPYYPFPQQPRAPYFPSELAAAARHESRSSALRQVERLASQFSDRASDAWGDATGFAQRYPWAAFGAGVVLGCLLACSTSRGDWMTRQMSKASV
jgi:hypothetical protein